MQFNLITTGPTQIKNKQKSKFFFLGNWCIKFDKKILFQKNSKYIADYHWDDKKKFNKDYSQIILQTENLLDDLGKTLNILQNKKISKQQWKIILYPWLIQYVTILYDRWETCENFIKKNNKDRFVLNYFKNDKTVLECVDHIDFTKKALSNKWNNDLFKKIFDYLDPKIIVNKKKIVEKKIKIKSNINNLNYTFSLQNFLIKALSYFSFYTNQILFESFYFPKNLFLKLCLKNMLIPGMFFFNSTKKYSNYDDDLRNIASEIIKKKFINNNSNKRNKTFKNFLYETIFEHIPLSYLESFDIIFKKSSNLPSKKIIFTMHSNQWNDFFKIYLAIQKKNNAKIIISDHGGGLLPKIDPLDNFNEKVFYKRISYFRNRKKKFYIYLSPTFYLINKNERKNYDGKTLLFSLTESHKFQFKPVSVPFYNDWLSELKSFIFIAKNLKKEIKDNFKFRIKNLGYLHDNFFEAYKILSEVFGKKKVDIKNRKSYFEAISKSKLVIHNYGQTSFTECMYLNIPSIIFFKKNIMQLDIFSNQIFKNMKKKNIAFEDPKKLVKHVNQNWHKLDSWWNSIEVQKLRKIYLENYFKKKDVIADWDKFLKNIKN